MSKDKKLALSEVEGLIPELRFPEFNNAGEWKENVLSNITDAIFDGTHQTPTYTESGIPFFSVENIVSGNKNKFISKEDYEIATIRNKPEKGDVLLTRIGKIGFSAIVDWDYEFSIYVTLACIKQSKKFNSYYLHSYFQSSSYQKEILSKSLLNAVPMKINMDELRKTRVLLPPDNEKKEQQKIASCLSSLDEVITAHNQKLELLKDHKKGLMQNLFPQEGEKVPKYRFKEFVNDGEWVEEILDEVATFLKGKGISKSDVVENGILPCVRYGELYTHYNETISRVISYTNISDVDLVLSEANDVIIPASGETKEDIATASCVLQSGIALGGDLNIIRTKINGVFLSYFLNNVKKKEIAQLAQGYSVVHLYPNHLKTLKINVPKSKEQQKIASCLSSLDALIAAQAEKIEQLKLHKKGLMQGLFPKID